MNTSIWSSEELFKLALDSYYKQGCPRRRLFKYKGLTKLQFASLRATAGAISRKTGIRRAKKNGKPRIKNRKTGYNKYIKSKEWGETRKLFIQSVFCTEKCAICGGDKQLQIHHRDYGHIGKERYCDLIRVCGRCHRKLHGLDNGNASITLKWYLREREYEVFEMKYEQWIKLNIEPWTSGLQKKFTCAIIH